MIVDHCSFDALFVVTTFIAWQEAHVRSTMALPFPGGRALVCGVVAKKRRRVSKSIFVSKIVS
jgi:hypothetical protein